MKIIHKQTILFGIPLILLSWGLLFLDYIVITALIEEKIRSAAVDLGRDVEWILLNSYDESVQTDSSEVLMNNGSDSLVMEERKVIDISMKDQLAEILDETIAHVGNYYMVSSYLIKTGDGDTLATSMSSSSMLKDFVADAEGAFRENSEIPIVLKKGWVGWNMMLFDAYVPLRFSLKDVKTGAVAAEFLLDVMPALEGWIVSDRSLKLQTILPIGLSLVIYVLGILMSIKMVKRRTDLIARRIEHADKTSRLEDVYKFKDEFAGSVLPALDAIIRDVNKAREDLEKIKHQLVGAMEIVDDGLLITDDGGGVLTYNHQLLDMMKLRGDKDVKKAWDYVLNNNPEFDKLVGQAQSSDNSGSSEDFLLELPGGRKAEVRLASRALKSNGTIVGTVFIFKDLREIRKNIENVRRSSKLSAISKLAMSIAHEIKNPLNSIMVNMEILKQNILSMPEKQVEKANKYVDIIHEESKRLDKVISAFLEFAGPTKLNLRDVNINQIVKRITSSIKTELNRQKINIDLNVSDDLPKIKGDSDRIRQALLNLILYSTQSMPEGGYITIDTYVVEEDLYVKIHDTGSGIPEEMQDRIITDYYSSDSYGISLGLPLVYHIVELHNGDVALESVMGKGTTFVVRFPIQFRELA